MLDHARGRGHEVDGDGLGLPRHRQRRRLPGLGDEPRQQRPRQRAYVQRGQHAIGQRHQPQAQPVGAASVRITSPASWSVASSRDAVLALTPIRRASSLTPEWRRRRRRARRAAASRGPPSPPDGAAPRPGQQACARCRLSGQRPERGLAPRGRWLRRVWPPPGPRSRPVPDLAHALARHARRPRRVQRAHHHHLDPAGREQVARIGHALVAAGEDQLLELQAGGGSPDAQQLSGPLARGEHRRHHARVRA